MKEFDPFSTEITQIAREYFSEYPTEPKQLESQIFFDQYKERSFPFIVSLLAALAIRPDMKICFYFDTAISEREKHLALSPSIEWKSLLGFWDFVFMQGNIKIAGSYFMRDGETCGEWKL